MNNIETSAKFRISQKQEVQGRKIFLKLAYGGVSDGENNFYDEEIRSFSEIPIVISYIGSFIYCFKNIFYK